MSKTEANGRLVPAVAYLRRSTDKQEASIADQRKAVQRYADEHGYKLLRWYTDDAVSGDDTEKRYDFQRMLADAQQLRDFNAILCWDQSRFGRFSPQEAGYWTFPLAKANIRLVTTDKGSIDWSDFTGWLTYSVDQHAKHEYVVNLSRDVARGQLEAANKGSWASGQPPYAYRIEGPKKNKRLVVDDPGKVRIVQRIFREFVEEGRSMKNIADRLNAEGYLSPGGRVKGWRFDTVKVILENPAYIGDYAGCRYSFGKYHTIHRGTVAKSTGRSRRPESEWIMHRDHHEPIIDRATFAKAQAILAKGKTGRAPHTPETNPYILSGLLRCGRKGCGCTLDGLNNGTHRYYECGNRKYNGEDACEGTTVREDTILRSIAKQLDQEFLSLDGEGVAWKAHRNDLKPGDLPQAFAKVMKLVAPPKQPAVDRQRTEKRAKTLADQIHKARGNLVLLDRENIPAAQDEIRRLQSERENLELELQKRPPTEEDVNAVAMEVLQSLYWLAIFFRLTADPQNPETTEGPCLTGDFTPWLKRYLRNVAGITVHTRKQGQGRGTRHEFLKAEMAFSVVGGDTGKVNSHRTD